ncbi:MAG: helix-turn-helix domain-containing protein [Acidimicrobiia bacterium]|nr:helix-turn-helix domain-containing protein [Acidimicrobiia bacterium]
MPALAYSYADAGKLLGKGPSTISRLVAEGRMHAIGRGSGKRIPATELDRYISEELSGAAS